MKIKKAVKTKIILLNKLTQKGTLSTTATEAKVEYEKPSESEHTMESEKEPEEEIVDDSDFLTCLFDR